ncbi:hypothetical protein BC332_24004 [Capsicum chinense]|nr:hypothetical protein BC332_24004 [Capsicum chinense]
MNSDVDVIGPPILNPERLGVDGVEGTDEELLCRLLWGEEGWNWWGSVGPAANKFIVTKGKKLFIGSRPNSVQKLFMKAWNELTKEMKVIIEEKRVKLLENLELRKVDVLTQLINEQDENGKYMSEIELTDKVFGFIIGSYDTTATTITLSMKHLEEKIEFFTEIIQLRKDVLS